MVFKIRASRAFSKHLSRLPKNVQEVILHKYIPVLAENPWYGERMREEFKIFWKFKFRYKNVDYRIIYQIFKSELLVILIAVGSRENFYKKLKRRL